MSVAVLPAPDHVPALPGRRLPVLHAGNGVESGDDTEAIKVIADKILLMKSLLKNLKHGKTITDKSPCRLPCHPSARASAKAGRKVAIFSWNLADGAAFEGRECLVDVYRPRSSNL
jgi:hypothetical protein